MFHQFNSTESSSIGHCDLDRIIEHHLKLAVFGRPRFVHLKIHVLQSFHSIYTETSGHTEMNHKTSIIIECQPQKLSFSGNVLTSTSAQFSFQDRCRSVARTTLSSNCPSLGPPPCSTLHTLVIFLSIHTFTRRRALSTSGSSGILYSIS